MQFLIFLACYINRKSHLRCDLTPRISVFWKLSSRLIDLCNFYFEKILYYLGNKFFKWNGYCLSQEIRYDCSLQSIGYIIIDFLFVWRCNHLKQMTIFWLLASSFGRWTTVQFFHRQEIGRGRTTRYSLRGSRKKGRGRGREQSYPFWRLLRRLHSLRKGIIK